MNCSAWLKDGVTHISYHFPAFQLVDHHGGVLTHYNSTFGASPNETLISKPKQKPLIPESCRKFLLSIYSDRIVLDWLYFNLTAKMLYFMDECPCNLSETQVVHCTAQQLTAIPVNMSISLVKVIFSHNEIRRLDETTLARYSSLSVLRLENNSISELPSRTFASNPNLTHLWVFFNSFSLKSN